MINKSPYYYAAEALFGDKVEDMEFSVQTEEGQLDVGCHPGWGTGWLVMSVNGKQIAFAPDLDRSVVASLVDVMQAWVDADCLHEYPKENNE